MKPKQKRRQFTYYPYNKPYVKKDEKVKTAFDSILADLEKYGRAFTANHRAPKKLSFAMKNARDNGYIRFAQESRRHEARSMIVLKPGVKLKVSSNKVVKLWFAP